MTVRTAPRDKDRLKTYCKNLTIDHAFVRAAFKEWTTASAGKKNQWRVDAEHGSEDGLITEIVNEIRTRTLSFRPIHYYRATDPANGKQRIIGVSSVKQQVADYVAVRALTPLLDAKIGFYQVASVRGKGQVFAARTIRKWAREGGYWLKMDVRQCYPSIHRDVAYAAIAKHVRHPDVLYLVDRLLASYEQGLSIGSYFSLKVAQLVMAGGYHHLEDLQSVRRGKRRPLVHHKIFFMDDVLLMGPSKRDLKKAARSLATHMRTNYGLEFKPWKVCRVGDQEPIDFAGYTIRPDRTTIRASIFLKARRSLRHFERHPSLDTARTAVAYRGWLIHADTTRFRERVRADDLHTQARQLISIAAKEAS